MSHDIAKAPAASFEYTLPVSLRKFEDRLNAVFKLSRRNVTVKSGKAYSFRAFLHNEAISIVILNTSIMFFNIRVYGFAHCFRLLCLYSACSSAADGKNTPELSSILHCLASLTTVRHMKAAAGYNPEHVCVITAATCGIGSILSGLVSNLPFIISPLASISIFLSYYLRTYQMEIYQGNHAVAASGFFLIVFGYRPIGRLANKLIPTCIQVSTTIGIGLLTTLAGCTEIALIVKGKYVLIEMGEMTDEIQVAMAGVMIIAVLLHYHVKAAFAISMLFCTLVWWVYSGEYPEAIAAAPVAPANNDLMRTFDRNSIVLMLDLAFLEVVCVNGLAKAFSDLAGITNEANCIPRGRWLYLFTGALTIFSGLFGGAPVVLSAENPGGIKAGARTGLSAVLTGNCTHS